MNVQRPKLKIDTQPLQQLTSALTDLDEMLTERNKLIARVCKDIEPFVRVLLLESLKRSGLDRQTGELESFVSQAVVIPTRKGFRIAPPRGLSADQYAKMGALQHGSMRRLVVQDKKSRKKIKAAAMAAGGSGVVKAHPYFQLGTNAIKQLEKAFNDGLAAEINRFMAARTA